MPKAKSSLALAALIVLVLGAGLFAPRPSYAFPVEVTANAPDTAKTLLDKAKAAAMDSWRWVTIQALVTALDTATQRVAQNYATWLATGNAGQGPLAWLKSFGTIAGESYADAASDFVNTIAVKYTGYGLCQPIDPQVTLNIKLGIFRDLQPPKPKCTWNQFVKNYDQMKNTLESGAFLRNFAVAFQPAQNTIDNAIALNLAARNEAATRREYDLLSAATNGRFKDLVSPISGNIKTPASMIQSDLVQVKQSAQDANKAKFEATINYTTAASNALSGIAANAGRMFLNTLANKLLEKYTKAGMFTLADVVCSTRLAGDIDYCKKGGASGVPDTVAAGANAVALASSYYSSIFASTPSTLSDFSLVSDLIDCPAGVARNVWNCSMDRSFAEALQRQDTGGYSTLSDLLANGKIKNLPLIGKGDSRDGLADCYTKGYCWTNLRKLRRAQIIPVGWEMAAASNSLASGSTTLKEVMDHFTDCNASGGLDSAHPWCHLIDPDWVMKAPLEQCNALVNGQTLQTANTPDRAQVCADVASCISEDANGKCDGGYGYCTREKSGWSINADSCPAQYGSCESYSKANLAENEREEQGSWLSNTLDSSFCTAESAGCRSFSASKSGGFWTTNSRLSLTSSAGTCKADEAGCTSLIEAATTTTLNLLPNPSFEIADSANPNIPAGGWGGDTGTYVKDAAAAYDNESSLLNPTFLAIGGYQSTTDIPVEPNQTYTLSFYARGSGSGTVGIKLFNHPFRSAETVKCPNASDPNADLPACLTDLSAAAMVPTCATTSGQAINCPIVGTYEFGVSFPNALIASSFGLAPGYERYTITFATPSDAYYFGGLWGGILSIDAVQLEKAPAATLFHVGGSDNDGLTALVKAPPEYLGCTGDPATDDPFCVKYAAVCRQTEDGCDGYTPVGGGTRIPGVATVSDSCPDLCVGYDTFKQERTQWEVAASDGARFPKYFIPRTARQCTFSEVGCDEFTSLEEASAGGETKNYFTFLRACRKPDDASDATYFLWEGSDVSGYQLRSYVMRNIADTQSEAVADAVVQGGVTYRGPVYVRGTNPALCTRAIYELPKTDPNSNPDCREFFDVAGNGFYRLLSKTVISSEACQNFRKTVSTQPDCEGTGGLWQNNACVYQGYRPESKVCTVNVNGCRLFTGNNGANTEIVYSESFENGLAGWTGPATAISNEATDVGGHSAAVGGAYIYKPFAASAGQVLVERGRSYTFTVWAKGNGSFNAAVANSTGGDPHYFNGSAGETLRLGADWQRYVLGPLFVDWDPPADSIFAIYTAGSTTIDYFDNIELTATTDQFALVKDSWNTPPVCDQTLDGAELPQAQLGCTAYNNTAGETKNLKSFTNLCRESAIGCKGYVDRRNTATPFSTTYNERCQVASAVLTPTACVASGAVLCTIPVNSNYCLFNQVGKRPTVTAPAGATIVDVGTPDVFTVPADTVRYLVAKESDKCEAAAVGCTELGEIKYGSVGTCQLSYTCAISSGCACTGVTDSILAAKTGGTACFVASGENSCEYSVDPSKENTVTGSAYRLVRPDDFEKGDLCRASALGCDAWNSGAGDSVYFKNPGELLCEYRSGIAIAGNNTSGWFKKGTNEPCDPKYIIEGTNFGIHRNLDQYYAGFAGVCPQTAAGCTEYRDMNDQTIAGGRPYFFIANNKISDAVAACGGKVSNKKGCIIFNDQSNPSLVWSTSASYEASKAKSYALVDPVPGTTTVPADGNIILKAQLDRTCTEWFECSAWETTVNAEGKTVSQCIGLSYCDQKDSSGNCTHWMSNNGLALTTANYVRRSVDFGASDYSGYSVPGVYPIGKPYQQGDGTLLVTGSSEAIISGNVPLTCKSYPEADSPFPFGAAPEGSNVCEWSASGKNCECSYRKVTYGSTVKYFQPTAEAGIDKTMNKGEIPSAICTSGAYEGEECSVYASGDRTGVNLSCSNGKDEGTCLAISRVDSRLGTKGYCLETDPNVKASPNGEAACLTWLPIDQPNGRDPNNLFATAGFLAKPGQEMYCAAPLKVCVPHECANNAHANPNFSDIIPPICTQLQHADITVTLQNPGGTLTLPDGCFNGCYLGDTPNPGARDSCISQENSVCGGYLRTFCSAVGFDSSSGTATSASDFCAAKVHQYPECQRFDETDATSTYCTDAFNYCIDYIEERQIFCSNLYTGNCFTNYGGQITCSEDLGGIASSFCGRVTDGSYPSCSGRVSGVNCHDPSYTFQLPYGDLYIAPANNAAKTIGSCNDIGQTSTKFCGNTGVCGTGEECVPVNDLTVHQTEYTEEEATEVAPIYHNTPGDPNAGYLPYTGAAPNQTLVSVPLSYPTDRSATDGSRNLAAYSTIPELGAHTYLTSTGLAGFPTLSSDALIFKPSLGNVSGDFADFKGTKIPNDAPESKTSNPNIGSYPNDLIGMYYLGKANNYGYISMDYDLVSPQLLFVSQVSRITARVFSYQRNGLCRYGMPYLNGTCYGLDDSTSPPTAYPYKFLSSPPTSAASYGYTVYAGSDDWQFNQVIICDDENDTDCENADTVPIDMILTSGNGWTAQASANEGSLKISLRLSDSEPKRIIGVHIEASDEKSRGYFYLSNFDMKLVGPSSGAVCGMVAYAGSSNPLAEDATFATGIKGNYGVAKTQNFLGTTTPVINGSVINNNGTIDNLIRNIKYECNPWAAFAVASPATIVTMSTVDKCEISKGGIFAGASELLKLFARVLGVGLFNDDRTRLQTPYFAYYPVNPYKSDNPAAWSSEVSAFNAIAPSTPIPPTLNASDISINNVTGGYIAGRGSVRADLKFFASADLNQLPLKNVRIGWQNYDIYDSGNNNFYKNHKANCDAMSGTTPTGNTPENCDTNPFSYSHVYFCYGAGTTIADQDYPEIGVRSGDGICRFRPTISVTDNWGTTTTPSVPSPVEIILSPY